MNAYHVGLAEGATVMMSADQIRSAYGAHSITLETKIWREGMDDWMTIADLAPELRLPPPPKAAPVIATGSGPDWPRHVARKSRGAYQVLALFFGALGIHNFYAGHIAAGASQLGLTLLCIYGMTVRLGGGDLTLLFGLLLGAIWLWNIIELCMVDRDGNGVRFRMTGI